MREGGGCGGPARFSSSLQSFPPPQKHAPHTHQVKAYFDYVKAVRDRRAAAAAARALSGPPPANAADLRAALSRMRLPEGMQF